MIVLKVVFCVLLCLPMAYVTRFLVKILVEESKNN
ncbi:hypothetical protein EV211_13713 [Aminicella lysinilytica]|uniref:Uncharacterized protein n=1 Tax=Aminicella lysinilytica TaxID=433323 RepID=A0A4R6PYR0_9FIRM|nr:hypothetical protein EV211_13713 [Aminicella lysinilytica]